MMIFFHEGDVNENISKEILSSELDDLISLFIQLDPDYSSVDDRLYLLIFCFIFINSFLMFLRYEEVQCLFDRGNVLPRNYYWKSLLFEEVNEKVVDKIIKSFKSTPKECQTTLEIMHLGGKMKQKNSCDSAFFHREANYEIHTISFSFFFFFDYLLL